MAKYNIYGHVLYSEIEYEKLMFKTEKIFIRALMNRLPDIDKWTDDIWLNIDHEYMIQTLEEIKKDVINTDVALLLQFKDTAIDLKTFEDFTKMIDIDGILERTKMVPDLYDISSIEKFKTYEKVFSNKVATKYKHKLENFYENLDPVEYLTNQIKSYDKSVNNFVTYYNKARTDVVRHFPISTYLSMLYNVNLTRTGWNQTFKDAEYFEKDLMILETHPASCPLCKPMQGKVYSRKGKRGYPSMEEAYSHGVGHPNCKCEWTIYWDKSQLETQNLGVRDNYEDDQKKKAIEREIRKAENDLNLYNMIGNQDEVDKTIQKIERLKEKL